MANPVQSPSAILTAQDPEAERQRKQKSYAALGILMGTEPTAALGKLLHDDASDRLKNQTATRRRYLGNGFIMEPDGNVTRDEGMAAAEIEREDRLRGRMGYQNDLIVGRPAGAKLEESADGLREVRGNPEGGPPIVGPATPFNKPAPQPTASDFEKSREARRLQQEAQELSTLVGQQSGAVDAGKSALTDAIGKLPLVGGPAASAAGERLYTPDQRSVITRGAAFEQDLSNLAAGMAVTGFELEQRNRWSPFVPGISAAEARRRLANIEQRFGRKAEVAAPSRPGQGAAPQQPASGGFKYLGSED